MTHEQKLLLAIDKIYNDQIGWNENAFYDGSDYTAWKEEDLIKYIIDSILSEPNYLELEDSWEVLEAKHVRFLGKKAVECITLGRVHSRHKSEGKWVWEK